MILRSKHLLLGLLSSILVAGCPAVEVRDANEQLTGYYLAKERALEADDWKILETSLASLSTLAEDTAARARGEGDLLNRISLYRIAATAAWQAGDSEVVTYGNEGQALCAGDNYGQAPRDCGMLMVIPTLAGVDETTRRLNELQPQIRNTGNDVAEALQQDALAVYEDYKDAFRVLVSRREEIQASNAHTTFKQQLDNNIRTVFCSHLDGSARGLLVLAEPADPPDVDEELTRLGCDAVRQGLARETLGCLAAGCD